MTLAVNPQTGEAVTLTADGQWVPAKTAVNPTTKEVVAFDGKDWKPLPRTSKGAFGYVDDAVRSLASGVTFGYADEIAAKMDELTGRGKSYDENVQLERARDKQIPAVIAIPGQISGAVGGAVAAAPVAGAMSAVSGIARLPQMFRYILGGGAGGAAFGSGEAEEGGRLAGAAQGAGLGAAGGYVVPKVMAGASRVASGVRNAFSPRANAAADLERAMVRDGVTPQAVMQDLRAAQASRPDATLADVGGENVRGLVERVAQTPGAGRTVVIPALTERQQGQMGRLGADLGELTGTQRTAAQAVGETMQRRAADARPLYDEAFNFDAAGVPAITQAFERETGTGFGRAFMMRPEFRRTLQTEYGVANPADAPLMVQIDAWKRVADDFVRENRGTNKARVVEQMRDRVLSVVDQHNQTYANARNAWAGPSRYLEAIEDGRNILSQRTSAEELAGILSRMTDDQLEGFRIGAVSAIRAKMGSDPARMADMTKYLRSPEVRAKIAAIMPTDEARQAWTQRLNFEVGSSELVGRSLGNSATYRRGAERQDADGLVADLVMDALSGQAPVGIVRQVLGSLPRRLRDTIRSRSDNMVGNALVNPQAPIDRLMAIVAQRNGASPVLRNNAAINAANAELQ